MFRNALLFVSLLGLLSSSTAFAASTGASNNPNRRIRPGDHRPIYRQYGHHGMFENGLFGMFHRRGGARLSTPHAAKAHRGTL